MTSWPCKFKAQDAPCSVCGTTVKKQQGRTIATVAASLAAGIIRAAGNFINTALTRATQRTQRFIRWVRVWIYKEAPWRDSIARLREVWANTSA